MATPSPSASASSASQCHLCGVFGVEIMLENCRSAKFLKGGHPLLLQNVIVNVGIHVSLNVPQLPNTSSSHAAQDHDVTTPRLTVGKVQFSWYSSPGHRHTCWTPSESNKALRLIRPQGMVPVIHVLGQVVFSKLFAGFFVSQLASF